MCRACQKLGKEELGYRQQVRNIERLLDGWGYIPRKRWRVFERYLRHKDERVRRYAESAHAADAERRRLAREERRLIREQEEKDLEAMLAMLHEELDAEGWRALAIEVDERGDATRVAGWDPQEETPGSREWSPDGAKPPRLEP